jgi:hypothetical protein
MGRRKIKRSRRILVGPFDPTNQIRGIVIASYAKKSKNHLRLDFPISPLHYAKITENFHSLFAQEGMEKIHTGCGSRSIEDHGRYWSGMIGQSIFRKNTP